MFWRTLTQKSGLRRSGVAFFGSTRKHYVQPNAPLVLDPALDAFLRDTEISLQNHRTSMQKHRELQVIGTNEGKVSQYNEPEIARSDQGALDESELGRKSPAAQFGSQQIGAVVLPLELQSSINLLISEADKSQVHSDAMRLFQENNAGPSTWNIQQDAKYHSKRQAAKHAVRDGTAFASIALPAHYSAITAVLNHLKHRMKPEWGINTVIDWAAGTGSGLWASCYTFQRPADQTVDVEDLTMSQTTIADYVGIDKREGLVTIAKRLVNKLSPGPVITWKKSFKDEDAIAREHGYRTLALSAFSLSSLPNSLSQKELVKEMWSSGAHTIVLIDHNSQAGFEAIARAREYLLKMGRLETEDPETDSWVVRGSHVVAPCPHDRICPLLQSSGSLVCGFSQRIQRPSFVRLTKHSNVGHEDIGYSYVIIQRGGRPDPVSTTVGRIGAVGRRELASRNGTEAIEELEIHVEEEPSLPRQVPTIINSLDGTQQELTDAELESQLRLEAYQWPRLVFPPLKKSGHIILDSCTRDGKIMRLTIPKSQGKQPFYDARKSTWGDLFPHAPKNTPVERHQPRSKYAGTTSSTGGDIGKRRDSYKRQERLDYSVVAESLKAKRKLSKREYARTRVDKGWEDWA